MSRVFSAEEIAKHTKEDDCWVVINGEVYDVTRFAKFHPGGKHVLVKNSGREVGDLFATFHNESVLKKYRDKFLIGRVEETASEAKKRARPVHPLPTSFGDMIPYGDPLWYQRLNSPYYKETHRQWRAHVRAFVDEHIIGTLEQWKNADEPPRELLLKMGKAGLLASMTGCGWPREYLDADVKEPADFDHFHELITFDEISRCGHSAAIAAVTNGPAIALPVILRYGSEDMKRTIVPEVLMGRECIALAISEPSAGSDVAGLITEAVRQGDNYIVSGNKKWITNGTYSRWFVTAVNTGQGRGTLSFLLVERGMSGFSTRKVNIRDSSVSGTAYLDFDKTPVPVSNLLGRESQGFKLVMTNFNHERFYVTVLMCRLSRVCIEECIKYALRRRAFGKRLSEIQSIRMKIAQMAREVECLQAWIESLAFQMSTMPKKQADLTLGDITALLKAHGSKVLELCARETTMVFGGNALYVDGVGRKIEPAVMQVKGYQIPAGAEDVMDDYGARTAFKLALRFSKL